MSRSHSSTASTSSATSPPTSPPASSSVHASGLSRAMRPLAIFSGLGSSSASGSGSSTPNARNASRSPAGRKSSSASASTSVSPETGTFLALHPTISASTIRGGGQSDDDLRADDDQQPMEYSGGAPLRRPLTAPTPRRRPTELLEEDEDEVGATATVDIAAPAPRPPAVRLTTDGPRAATPGSRPSSSNSVPSGRPSRGNRPRASTGTTPSTRFVPISKPSTPSFPSRQSSFSPSRSPSTASLQSHLYTSGLLNATLSDVHLVVMNRYYRLHRIVMGQSGFFHSLLSGGFSEERSTPIKRGFEEDAIQVELDRPMTRAAFEYVVARLYGGGPDLVPPPWARTSATHPLSEPFERMLLVALKDKGKHSLKVVEEEWKELDGLDKHPATPTFLLSLLASSIYLETPSVQSTALQWIQRTITPWTVGRYLAFALGKGLGRVPHSELEMGCRGLEGVGSLYDVVHGRTASIASSSNASRASSIAGTDFDTDHAMDAEDGLTMFVGPEGERVGEACACWLAKFGGEILRVEEWLAEQATAEGEDQEGGDDSAKERQTTKLVNDFFFDEGARPSILSTNPDLAVPPLRVWSSLEGGLPARWVRGVVSSDAFFIPGGQSPESDETRVGRAAQGADGEFERYLLARRIVEFRRREQAVQKKLDRARRERERVAARERRAQGKAVALSLEGMIPSGGTSSYETAGGGSGPSSLFEEEGHFDDLESLRRQTISLSIGGHDEESADEDGSHKCGEEAGELGLGCEGLDDEQDEEDPDELEYEELFATGIHYSHLSADQLRYVSRDISPSTGLPFVPQSVIERAFWQADSFTLSIPKTSVSMQSLSSHSAYSRGGAVRDGTAADDAADLGLSTTINPSLKPNRRGQTSSPFFLVPIDDTTRINDCSPNGDGEGDVSPPKKAKGLPSGAEGFFGLGKETRLGVPGSHGGVFGTEDEAAALRRFIQYEPLRISVEFWGVQGLKDKQRLYSNTWCYAGSFFNLYLQKIVKKGPVQLGIYLHRQNPHEAFPQASQPPAQLGSSPSILSELFAQRAAPSVVASMTPYTDRRKAVQAYFSFWCPTQLGTSITRFSSKDDSFSQSQSWGWKSSSLALSENANSDGLATDPIAFGRFSSLRVTIVMGVV